MRWAYLPALSNAHSHPEKHFSNPRKKQILLGSDGSWATLENDRANDRQHPGRGVRRPYFPKTSTQALSSRLPSQVSSCQEKLLPPAASWPAFVGSGRQVACQESAEQHLKYRILRQSTQKTNRWERHWRVSKKEDKQAKALSFWYQASVLISSAWYLMVHSPILNSTLSHLCPYLFK